ncbi:GNAT family N-acetyltransferase [Xenorhabdus sp. PR6a]|uniref:GNAT family N-acetyltransferase n=1 Tax=Xenorhabdus sp. PR6a TaxID=3025877 RepID=UPI002359BC55|nr:GNAT family N-acetyltransferase [Xenorhabdus sp. PR6a]MDC9581106.1 GNAT family N-acetyltransferase [Xenorhabdus sp. PR6a]
MFRSKSFNNINQPSVFGHLTHAKSASDINKTVLDARTFITIRRVGVEEIYRITQRVINNSQGWEYNNSSNFPDDEQTKWNDRHDYACNMLSNMGRCMKHYADRKKIVFFVAYFQGVPVGALQFNPNDGCEIPEVDYLATHCGIRNCGVLLMEYAVNESRQLKMGGQLRLTPLDNAISAYLKMGFTELSGSTYLYLNPAESNKWDCSNLNRYRYRN